ncbi:MAG: flavodoxin [Limosilactobacillus sp.]|uniref:flavodoxin n=1 Tax=Limosilactobacillus sp. TaxID=2773925 RepID=UPI00270E80C6|nr:flavodoxin [Limosilactobacillus sp.]
MKALVVYATITGNNKDVADLITESLEDRDVEVDVDEISVADPADFEDVDICVVCPYTYSEGSLPEEGMDFYEDLKEEDLKGKVYGVAGSGDVFYGDDFCRAVTAFDKAFAETGATKGSEDVRVNLAPDGETVKKLDQFADELVKKVNG